LSANMLNTLRTFLAKLPAELRIAS
jgi:hypothetical protein